MNSEVNAIKVKAEPVLKAAHVRRAAVFGSFARGEDRKNSDVDILVELAEDKTLLDLIELKLRLEEKIGRSVDVVTYRSVSALLKDRIQEEQIKIYG